MTLNCIIVDDEPLAAQLLQSYAVKTPQLNLIGAYNSAIEASRALRDNHIDLVFLDIQMPELSGLEFAKLLSHDTKVIFTTAFNQYAIEGYKVNALDYLLKPISFEDFTNVVKKALDYFDTAARAEASQRDRIIFVKSDYKLQRISLDDILYIEGVKDYVKFYLDGNAKPVMSLMNMSKIEAYLPQPEFMRVHRSYIAHMTKIDTVDRTRLVYGDELIPVSGTYKDAVEYYLDTHTLI